MHYFSFSLARVFTIVLSGLAIFGACGKSEADIAAGFEQIEKGALASEVRERLGDPERVESSPQIPDLEHWKYSKGRLTVSLLQGRVLGKFDTGPVEPALPVLENGPNSGRSAPAAPESDDRSE